jgi:hypothetical protein
MNPAEAWREKMAAARRRGAKAEPYRLRNGTRIRLGDWVGIVVDQSGSTITFTGPRSLGLVKVDRLDVVKRHGQYVIEPGVEVTQ